MELALSFVIPNCASPFFSFCPLVGETLAHTSREERALSVCLGFFFFLSSHHPILGSWFSCLCSGASISAVLSNLALHRHTLSAWPLFRRQHPSWKSVRVKQTVKGWWRGPHQQPKHRHTAHHIFVLLPCRRGAFITLSHPSLPTFCFHSHSLPTEISNWICPSPTVLLLSIPGALCLFSFWFSPFSFSLLHVNHSIQRTVSEGTLFHFI